MNALFCYHFVHERSVSRQRTVFENGRPRRAAASGLTRAGGQPRAEPTPAGGRARCVARWRQLRAQGACAERLCEGSQLPKVRQHSCLFVRINSVRGRRKGVARGRVLGPKACRVRGVKTRDRVPEGRGRVGRFWNGC